MPNIKFPRYLFVISAAILTTFAPCSGKQVSLEQAIANASGEIDIAATRSNEESVYTSKEGNLSVAYILNRQSGGFVVLAADDIFPAVIGYADYGHFNSSDIPPAFKSWLKDCGRLLEYVSSHGYTKTQYPVLSGKDPIKPLCRSKWDQLNPFNDNCPIIDGTKAPTGCTATAMAQVMYTHKWPLTGSGTHTYTPSSLKEPLSFDFGGTTFDWDNMAGEYLDYTDEQAKAVALLMQACGNASMMDYGKDASGASYYDAIYGMVKYLGYDKSAILAERDFYTSADWNELIYHELSNNRPVLYCGYNFDAGHSFVVDGYNNGGFFHVNWGWSGISDGYFRLSHLDPDQQGTGGSSEGYNFYQSAILNVMPARENSEYQSEIMLLGGFSSGANAYPATGKIEFTATDDGYFKDFTLIEQKATLGVKLTPSSGGEPIFYPGSEVDLKPYYGKSQRRIFRKYFVDVSALPKSGTYTATPAYSIAGNVKDIAVKVGEPNSLKLSFASMGVKIEHPTVVRELTAKNLRLETPLYTDRNCILSATVNNKGEEYLGIVVPAILDNKGYAIAWLDGTYINLTDGESENITISGIFKNDDGKPVSPGDYAINLYDESGNALCAEPLKVTVLEVPSGKPSFTSSLSVSSSLPGAGTESDPFLIGNTLDCELTVNVSKGLFEDIVALFAYYADDYSPVDYTDDTLSYDGFFVAEGRSETKKYTLGTSTFLPDKTVFIEPYGYTPDFAEESTGWFGKRIYVKRSESGVETTESDRKVSIFPNPATDIVNVSSDSAMSSIEIYSLTGAKIMTVKPEAGSMSTQIDVCGMPRGHYIVVVTTQNKAEHHRLLKR